jgi:hypothetical protein
MILITKLATSILIQRDDTEIAIDDRAIRVCLGAIISELVSDGRALAAARRESYEAGLLQGHEQGRIEAETRERIADRQASELVDILVGIQHASAA